MDPLFWLSVFLFYIAIPVVVFAVAGYAKPRLAKWLLRGTAVLCLTIFGLVTLANFDCVQAEITFISCNRLPDAFGDAMGLVQILYVVSYLTAGPAVLLLAAGLEWWARRGPGTRR